MTVSVDVTNAGRRAGDEVVQLYVRHPASKVERPRRALRGYARVSLRPGETRTVRLRVPASSLRDWDDAADAGRLEPGAVELEVGASSADIRLRRALAVGGDP